MESKALLSVLGITVGDSMDDADKAFGMPDSRSMSEKIPELILIHQVRTQVK